MAWYDRPLLHMGFWDYTPTNACQSRTWILSPFYSEIPWHSVARRSRRSRGTSLLARVRLLLPREKHAPSSPNGNRYRVQSLSPSLRPISPWHLPSTPLITRHRWIHRRGYRLICIQSALPRIRRQCLSRIITALRLRDSFWYLRGQKALSSISQSITWPHQSSSLQLGYHGIWCATLHPHIARLQSMSHTRMLFSVCASHRRVPPRAQAAHAPTRAIP